MFTAVYCVKPRVTVQGFNVLVKGLFNGHALTCPQKKWKLISFIEFGFNFLVDDQVCQVTEQTVSLGTYVYGNCEMLGFLDFFMGEK